MHKSQNSEALEAQNRAVEGSKWSPGGSTDKWAVVTDSHHSDEEQDPDPY
jgi:hypothetical protein